MKVRGIEYQVPNSRPLATAYRDALKELALPYPSVKTNFWGKFDHITGGFRPREFTILCGATGAGKTTLLANICAALQLQGTRQFIASVETGDTDFVKRVMSVHAQRDLNTGDAVPVEDLKKFQADHGAKFSAENIHLSLYDDRVPDEVLEAELLYHYEKKKCQVAMLDNLNFFMEVADERKAVAEMDRVVHRLIILAKKIDMHIIMVMHPKKTESGRVTSEFDIKGSSTAVQEAHNIWLFNRPSQSLCEADKTITPRTHREITFAKMRRRGKFTGARLVLKNIGASYIEQEVFWND